MGILPNNIFEEASTYSPQSTPMFFSGKNNWCSIQISNQVSKTFIKCHNHSNIKYFFIPVNELPLLSDTIFN